MAWCSPWAPGQSCYRRWYVFLHTDLRQDHLSLSVNFMQNPQMTDTTKPKVCISFRNPSNTSYGYQFDLIFFLHIYLYKEDAFSSTPALQKGCLFPRLSVLQGPSHAVSSTRLAAGLALTSPPEIIRLDDLIVLLVLKKKMRWITLMLWSPGPVSPTDRDQPLQDETQIKAKFYFCGQQHRHISKPRWSRWPEKRDEARQASL